MTVQPQTFPPPSWWAHRHAGERWWALRASPRGMTPRVTESLLLGTPAGLRFPAQHALERRGIKTYVPTESWSRRKSRFTMKRETITKPLIPGLLFARLPERPNWYVVMNAPFVLGAYGVLCAIRDLDGFEGLERAASDEIDPYSLKPGGQAILKTGSMEGCTITLTEVLVDIPEPVASGVVSFFGGKVKITVPLEDLKGVRV